MPAAGPIHPPLWEAALLPRPRKSAILRWHPAGRGRVSKGGTYVLALWLPAGQAIPIGGLGRIRFPQDGICTWAVPLDPEEFRHAWRGISGWQSPGLGKRLHWHIDYLREHAIWGGAWACLRSAEAQRIRMCPPGNRSTRAKAPSASGPISCAPCPGPLSWLPALVLPTAPAHRTCSTCPSCPAMIGSPGPGRGEECHGPR